MGHVWDNCPHPVMLVRKDRTIIEANKADQALSQQAGVREVAYYEHLGQVIDGYWVPLAGADDIYVHFGIDISEYAAERLFPKKSGNSSCNCSDGGCGGL